MSASSSPMNFVVFDDDTPLPMPSQPTPRSNERYSRITNVLTVLVLACFLANIALAAPLATSAHNAPTITSSRSTGHASVFSDGTVYVPATWVPRLAAFQPEIDGLYFACSPIQTMPDFDEHLPQVPIPMQIAGRGSP